MNPLVEVTSNKSTEKWAENVGWHVNQTSLRGVREDRRITEFLEIGLEESDDRINAATGNSADHGHR